MVDRNGVGMGDKLVSAIGGKAAKLYSEKLELETVGDLLRYYPRKHNTRGEVSDLGQLVVGELATVVARVVHQSSRETYRKGAQANHRDPRQKLHVLVLRISDGKHEMECSFFNQRHRAKDFPVGTVAVFSGKVKEFNNKRQMGSPAAESLSDDNPNLADVRDRVEDFANGIIPVYALSEGVTMSGLQKSVKTVLDQLLDIPDPLPDSLLKLHGLLDLRSALLNIHRPTSTEALEKAKARLRYDEALALQLVLAKQRAKFRNYPAEPCPPRPGGLMQAFDERLPFDLTAGQREVGQTLSRDLSGIHPMNRLLQGEVGSGKTVVALRAMLQVIDNQRQTVLMAPTEVLAAQHARSVRDILGPLAMAGELGAPEAATKVTLLTGSMGAAARKQALLDIASGQAGIAVGTHALLGKDVFFENLGLIVVDEQHRFGVEQRDQLRSKHHETNPPHVLVMTATPIPRTVAMTVYGDLETSALHELPRGRSPIKTTVVPSKTKPHWLDRAWEKIREEVASGRQAYVVCPRIGDEPDGRAGVDSDDTDDDFDDVAELAGRRAPLAVLDVFAQLQNGPLAGLRLGMLHGKLNPFEKDDVMAAFKEGQLDVLIATTVIEVGVDVPNATMMIVMDAERFGMSQLHQLRGRVGRGQHPGVCLLVTEMMPGYPSMRRLDAVAQTLDGFELAKKDLEQRREGDILGRIQAGRGTSLRLLSVLRDEDVIATAREDAQKFIDTDVTLRPWPGLAEMANGLINEEGQKFLEKG